MTASSARPPRVSVVLPIFNERANLEPLIAEITDALTTVPHEIIAVNDGSTDGSLAMLEQLAPSYPSLRIVSLPERSGQSAALAAGFDRARSPLIATLDADGQNDPADLIGLIDAVECGDADATVGMRLARRDSAWKLFQSRTANLVRNWITGDRIRDTGCSIRVMRTEFARRVPRFRGMHRFMPTLLRREGARVIQMEVRHRPRLRGQTKYGMWDRIFVGIWDSFGIRWLLRRRIPASTPEEAADDH